MIEKSTDIKIAMNIYLSDSDIAQMPEPGRTWFLDWLPKRLQSREQFGSNTQLPMNIDKQALKQEKTYSHVRLTQLFDAGLTKTGMAVRVKLKQSYAKQTGCKYMNSLKISRTGTIIYQGEEFDKPSPLAAKFNGSTNGWEYVEVKKDGQWIRLDELRENWRKLNE